VGAGEFADVSAAVDRCVQVTGSTRPNSTAQARYEQNYAVYRELYGALRNAMHALAVA
jgi:xylulokinase